MELSETETRMTCDGCQNAKGSDIKMCDIFKAPCYDKYANIDKCRDVGCKYFNIEMESEGTDEEN